MCIISVCIITVFFFFPMFCLLNTLFHWRKTSVVIEELEKWGLHDAADQLHDVTERYGKVIQSSNKETGEVIEAWKAFRERPSCLLMRESLYHYNGGIYFGTIYSSSPPS